MPSQAFLTTIAGLSISLAGFASLIAWLRDDASDWDPINLWRVKTIIRHALILAFLALVLVPVLALTEDETTTVRIGSALLGAFFLAEMLRFRHPDPTIWVPARTWLTFQITSVVFLTVQALNLWWAEVGVLQLGLLCLLSSPAGIFYNFVHELGPRHAVTAAE